MTTVEVSGWGNYPRRRCVVLQPTDAASVREAIRKGPVIARGLARSYADHPAAGAAGLVPDDLPGNEVRDGGWGDRQRRPRQGPSHRWFVRELRPVVHHPCSPNGSVVTASRTQNADLFWARCGGRLNLGKDALLGPDMFQLMYPQVAQWLAVKQKYDPGNLFASDLSRRLGLTPATDFSRRC